MPTNKQIAEQAAIAGKVSAAPIDTGSQIDAADKLSQLAAGNSSLITHPHLVTALMAGSATPAQAQAVNVFVTGMSAVGRMQTAQQTGTKITYSATEKSAMGALGVQPGDTEFTNADLQKQVAASQAAQNTGGGGWSFGRVLHDVTHNPVTNSITTAGNWTRAGANWFPTTLNHLLGGDKAPKGTQVAQSNQAMIAQGYDPNNLMSTFAYQASGKQVLDASDLYNSNDPDMVDKAIKFSDDPDGYIKSVVGQANLSPEQITAQLSQLQSKDFQNLVTQVVARKPTAGNLLTLGIDPVAHPALQRDLSAGLDIAVSFVADPTLLFLGGLKVVRATQIVLDGMGDTTRVERVLNGQQKGMYASQVRNGMQSLLTNSNAIRAANAAGDDAAAAAAYARIRNLTPGLEHLLPDFLGKTGTTLTKDGLLVPGEGTQITTMAEAAKYLSSKVGVVRLFSGKAPAEIGLMPGQLSFSAAKRIRAALAVGVSNRALARTTMNLNKAGVAAKILPTLDDAVDVATGKVLAAPEAADDAATAALASQQRASAIAAGDATFASRQGFGPVALKNRSLLFAQRWGSFLPKDVTFATSDPNAVKKVFQYANLYLTRGDANLLAARYAAGDEGVRKAVLTGLHLQTLHAAGLGTSEAGRAFIDASEAALNGERYSLTAGKFVDPATGLERDAAIWPGQVNEKLTLTNFHDLQKYAAKIGIFENTVGRGFNAQVTDHMMSLVKTGWLVTGSNVVRNAGEDLFGAFTRGELNDAMRAKAVGAMQGLLPERAVTDTVLKGLRRTRAGNLALMPAALVSRLYHFSVLKTSRQEAGLDYLLDPSIADELGAYSDKYVSGHLKSMIDPGSADADEITGQGFKPGRLKFKRTGYEERATEGLEGADRLSTALGVAINKNPGLTAAILDHLAPVADEAAAETADEAAVAGEAPETFANGADRVAKVRARMDARAAAEAADTSPEGKVLAAFKKIKDEGKDWQPIAELRDELDADGMSRAEQDKTLIAMDRSPHVHITQVSNLKSLTAHDHDSALMMGGQAQHAIQIAGDYISPAVEASTKSATSAAGASTPLYRSDVAGTDLASMVSKPHGAYASIERPGFKSPFQGSNDDFTTEYRGSGLPLDDKRVLNLAGKDVAHARFGDLKSGPGSAGVLAAKKLVTETDGDAAWEKLRTASKEDLVKQLQKRWPGSDYTKYADSYELLEVYGAQLARERGYHALHLPDKQMPDFSEYVGLTPESVRPIAPAVAPAVKTFGVDHVVDALKSDPRLLKMIRNGVFEDADGVTRRAVTPAEQEMAVTQLAQKQIDELRYLMSGQDGQLNDNLIQHVRGANKAPSTAWIMQNLAEDTQRPLSVLAPQFTPLPVSGGVNGLVGALADVSGKAYKALIEKPIARISSMPIFLANYGKTRAFMADWEQQLVDGGMTPGAANRAATDIGMHMAFNRTLKYIDDPTVRTQMDVVGRNFFAFSRATQGFLRRWGTQFAENPAQLRKAMLAMEASQRSGLVYTDPQGQKQFVFPGSGAAINAVMQVMDILPGVDLLKVPGVVPNMTGKFAFLSPGLQDPLQLSLTPLANIPMRAVFSLFPQHKQGLDEIDSLFNGSQGQGASPLQEITPTALKKFTDAVNPDDRDSLMADATRSAILNLSAAGEVPPPGADASQRQQFLSNLQVQVKNQLVARAIFGFFTPAPPGVPTEDTSGNKADWFYGATGVQNLDQEYKQLLNDSGGDPGRASQIWAGLHPDKQFYTVGTTDNMTKSAQFAATAASQQWINNNLGFMQNYKGVAAYFIPQSTQQGPFDLGAYNAELELGLRQHKTTAEFYNDVTVANSTRMYYQALDDRDAAVAAGPSHKSDITAQFSEWQKGFYALNPVFAETQTDYSQAAVTANDQLSQLRRLVNNPATVPADVPVGAISQAVDAYDHYHQILSMNPGETNAALAVKADVGGQYNEWWYQQLQANPGLAGMYQGVFRTLDNKVLDPIGSSS